MFTKKHILLTIDVEDWFQVENFKPWIPFSTWDQRDLRIEKSVHRLLNLFDSCEVAGKSGSLEISDPQPTTHNLSSEIHFNDSDSEFLWDKRLETIKKQHTTPNKQQTTDHTQTKKVKATFFVLGWLADRLPNIVRKIQSRGHEIASHGCNHELPELLSADELRQDLTDSKKLLEDITGSEVVGYRAPSFAINDDILKIIEDAGYLYDSSYNSFGLHGRYGKISLNGAIKKGIAHKLSDNFYELPISNLELFNKILPLGGGGYFRLTPYPLFRRGVWQILKKNDAYVFYMHPWELDPEQPKVNQASFNYRFRHYSNLKKTHTRLRHLLSDFGICQFVTCSRYLILAAG